MAAVSVYNPHKILFRTETCQPYTPTPFNNADHPLVTIHIVLYQYFTRIKIAPTISIKAPTREGFPDVKEVMLRLFEKKTGVVG